MQMHQSSPTYTIHNPIKDFTNVTFRIPTLTPAHESLFSVSPLHGYGEG